MLRESYGIDAPGVVRALAGFGALALGFGVWAALLIERTVWPSDRPLLVLRDNLIVAGTILILVAMWMVASSLWLKQRVLARLLAARQWRGDEVVLDIGSGRGLVAVGAARQAPHGRVTAIDLWQARDLSGNSPTALRSNAIAAGVSDRVTIDTGDARALPYAPGSFDVVASMTAIHNIADATGRDAAIAEAWRVLKPGGQILLYDIRHAPHYARRLEALGAADVRLSGPLLLWGVLGHRLTAAKPATATARPA